MATQFSGGTYASATFTGNARSDIQKNVAAQLVTAGWTSLALGSGQGPGNVGTVTITIASPAVVTFTGHGFLGGEKVILQTTGALPTGLSTNTVYFVKYIDANTFNLSTTSGGSNINTSGSQSGTHTLNTQTFLMQSATQANVTNPIRVLIKDNLGNCIQFSIQNQAGTVVGGNSTTAGGSLLPVSATTFQVIATQYHFMVFKVGSEASSRSFVMAGMLYVPSFLTGITDHGYMLCDSQNDADGTVWTQIRSSAASPGQNQTSYVQFIWNANLMDAHGGNVSSPGWPVLLYLAPVYAASPNAGAACYRWDNNDLSSSDVLLAVGSTSYNDEAKLKGQFFDLLYIGGAFTMDSTDTFNSHNWHSLTNNYTGTALIPPGGFWVATS